MALGMVCDINLARTATFDGPGFGATLERLGVDDRYVEAPARCANCTVLANSKFEVTLAQPRTISLIALLFHTLSPAAFLRITIAGHDLNLAAPALDTGWFSVRSIFYAPGTIPFEQEDWFGGQLSSEDAALWPSHKFLAIEDTIAGKIRVEINDVDNPAGWFDIGGLFIAPAFSPRINYDRGRDLALLPRDLVSEGPAGRRVGERRRGVRQLTLKWSMLTENEAYRFFDAGARAGLTETVIVVPDLTNEVGVIREAWPATFEKPPGPRFFYETMNEVTGVLKEIVA